MPVVHFRKKPYDVYIGRPSKWGNPFEIGDDGDREEVIQKYREWIVQQPELMAEIHTLHGKTLGCWCYPKKCHGKVLLEIAEIEFRKKEQEQNFESWCDDP